MEPEVTIRVIDLARELTKDLSVKDPSLSQDKIVEQRCKWFDQAYKAVSKTVRAR